MQTTLVIDVGNTHTHWGLARGLEILSRGVFATHGGLLARLPLRRAERAVYCSVVPKAGRALERFLAAKKIPFAALTHKNFPLPIRYDTPESLGCDRLALALGAVARGAKRAVVVDIGTAVTIDLADAKRGFLGGFIMPGLGLMLDSLHAHTAQLPALSVDAVEITRALPQTTARAVGAGCALAFEGGLAALIDLLARRAKTAEILVTGRGLAHFPKTRRRTFDPDLLLKGLALFAEHERAAGR